MPHSCAVVDLEDHFVGCEPIVRQTFDTFLAAARKNGPVTVNATKSRIAFQVRARFAGIDRPRRTFVVASFVGTEPVRSSRLTRVDYVPPYYYVHRLRLSTPADVDPELQSWLATAYQIGDQRHLSDPSWPRQRRPPDFVRLPREVTEAIALGQDPSTVR
jgi:hypothetical protein